MKNYLLIAFLFIGTISKLSAQSIVPERDSYGTFDVLSPTASYAPRYEFGFYKHLSQRWILGAEVGAGTYGTAINYAADGNWIEKKYLSFSFAPEIKYIINPKRETRRFVAAELFYIYHADNLSNRTYINTHSNRTYSFDNADYLRHKFGLNINYGMIVNFSKRVGIIPKIGAGIKLRDVEFSNQRNLVVRPDYEFSDVIIFPSSNHLKTEGFVSRFNFNLELQFFYKF